MLNIDPTGKPMNLGFLLENWGVQESYQEIQDFAGIVAGNSRLSRSQTLGFPDLCDADFRETGADKNCRQIE